MLVSESLCGKARQLLLLLDHPWQMTLLKVCLPELRSQALPLTFHRRGNGKILLVEKCIVRNVRVRLIGILWRAQLRAVLKRSS